MSRYAMRTRSIWSDDEKTWGESASSGIEKGMATYLNMKDRAAATADRDREWENEMRRAGGEVDPAPQAQTGWRDRIGQVLGRRSPSHSAPTRIPQMNLPMEDHTTTEQHGVAGHLMPRDDRPMQKLPPGVTPWNPNTPRNRDGNWLTRQTEPVQGGQVPEDYITQRGPSGQTARIPRTRKPAEVTPAELRAAIQKARAGDPTDLYALRPDLIDNDQGLFPAKQTGDTFDEFKQKDDYRTNNDIRAAGARSGMETGQIKLRDQLERNRPGGGANGGYDSKETSRGNAMVAAGNKLMDEAKDNYGNMKDQDKYDRGMRLLDQGTALLGEAPPPPKKYGLLANKNTAAARAKVLAAEARSRYPNATAQQIKNAVKNAMRDEGYPDSY